MRRKITILVTAGDTYEVIDDVRRITHMATGRLGSLIADEFAHSGAEVTLICGERSMRPALPMRKIIEIQGVESLQSTLIEQLSKIQFDCVVHSMAVSDYTVRGLKTGDADTLFTADRKISSDLDTLIVVMDRAPKVISYVKKIQPNTLLVGFKLLSNVPEKELVEAAQAQMRTSGSDFVLANDLSGIDGDRHGGLLIGHNGILDRPSTKHDIAKSIVHHVMNRIEDKSYE